MIKNPRIGASTWIHRLGPEPGIVYIDPRIALAQHIGWHRQYTGPLEFSRPEPDNYNFATLASKPMLADCIPNQVYYLDQHRLGWISLYHVEPTKSEVFKNWLKQQPWRSYWRNGRYVSIRPSRPLLHTRHNAVDRTLEEQLYAQGYYTKFMNKYTVNGHAEFIQRRLGEPRPVLVDSKLDSSEEESLYDF